MLKTYTITLGAGKAGLTDLRAQLLLSDGSNSGSAISTGFVAIGGGQYHWNYDVDDDFRGSVQFYSNAAPSVKFLSIAINPRTAASASSNPDTVNAFIYIRAGGSPLEGAQLHYQQLTDEEGEAFEDDVFTVYSDAAGLAEFDAVVGATYKYWVNNGRFKTVTIDGIDDPFELTAVAG